MHIFAKRFALGVTAGLLALGGVTAASGEESQTVASSSGETKKLFVITYRAGPGWKTGLPMNQQGLGPHAAYIKALFERGVVFAGGALGPEGGLVLLYARDQAEADRITADDPAVKTGIFVGEAQPWAPRFLSEAALTRTR